VATIKKFRLTPKDAIAHLKRLGSESRALFKAYDQPMKLGSAHVTKQTQEALEGLIERRLKGSLYKDFVAARIRIAKTHQVENALQEGTGDVVAHKLKGLATGGLKTIQQTAAAFPKALQPITSSMTGTSPLDWAIAGGGAMAAQNPAMLALLGARPLARQALLAKPFQQLPRYGNHPLLVGATGTNILAGE